MSATEELRHLAELNAAGKLSDEGLAAARRQLLGPEPVEAPDNATSEASVMSALARLDRDWHRETDRYLVTTRYGTRAVPTVEMSIVQGVVLFLFGAFVTVLIYKAHMPILYVLGGPIFAVYGILSAIFGCRNAKAYAEAEERYTQRRLALLDDSELSL